MLLLLYRPREITDRGFYKLGGPTLEHLHEGSSHFGSKRSAPDSSRIAIGSLVQNGCGMSVEVVP